MAHNRTPLRERRGRRHVLERHARSSSPSGSRRTSSSGFTTVDLGAAGAVRRRDARAVHRRGEAARRPRLTAAAATADDRRLDDRAPRPSSSSTSPSVYDRPPRQGTPGRGQRPLADGPGRARSASSSARRAAARRRRSRWSTGSSSRRRGRILHRRRRRRDPRRDRAAARRSATSSSRSGCSRTRRSARTWRRCRACSAGRRPAGASGPTSCSALVGPRPGDATATATRASCPAASASASGVARALAADPPIMLMDEPFGAVDPIVRERLQNEFLRLQEDLAKTILFVTHDIDEAIKMGDLVAVMQAGGRLAQFGPPAEILAAPGVRLRRPVRRRRPRPQAPVAGARRRPRARGRRSTARVGDDAAEARRRRLADPFALPAPGRRRRTGRSAGSTRDAIPAERRRSTRELAEPDVAAARPADDAQGRAVDAARRATSRPASSSTDAARAAAS